uniref:Tick transposon n=1 Tax=Rhipicephalus zambeziensis TaxID=60191 RepID=A0A224Z125_9ACAR
MRLLFFRKKGVCIGSCLAPILSDLFLAKIDRRLSPTLGQPTEGITIFRFVDDFMVFFNSTLDRFQDQCDDIVCILRSCLSPLVMTVELPVDGTIRFLDLKFVFRDNHTCWSYEPRAKKALLSFSSSHSKLIKRGIAKMCLNNALIISCSHLADASFKHQVSRLQTAGYPSHLIISVAEGLLRRAKGTQDRSTTVGSSAPNKENVAVIPYIHQVSHNLKKIAGRSNTRVLFSAPLKLGNLCKKTNPDKKISVVCPKKHTKPFIPCRTCVIYRIPLSCGRVYIGQTGRCINDRLREHSNKVGKSPPDGFLALHCLKCTCQPNFDKTVIVGKSSSEITRIVIEAEQIDYFGESCVSKTSLSLSKKELDYLRMC